MNIISNILLGICVIFSACGATARRKTKMRQSSATSSEQLQKSFLLKSYPGAR